MKKFISKVMTVIGIMLCMIPMAACQKETAPGIRDMYVVMYDGIGNEYKMYAKDTSRYHEWVAEYEYNPNIVYRFSCATFYRDNDEKFISRHLMTIQGDDVGEHIVSMINLSREYRLHVVIKDMPRLTPEVRFDPMGAVEYIENERYVYEYDGEEHYPHIKLSYNGEDLPLKNSGVLGWKNCETPHGSRGVEVGEYVMVYSVVDENYVHEYNKNKYESVGAEISIVIIPSSK